MPYTIALCEICGIERLVPVVKGELRYKRCRRCSNIGLKHGKAWNSGIRLMSKAYQWKGELAGYAAKHHFLRKILGNAKFCMIDPNHISKKYSWHNIYGNGSRTPSDYISVCESCHRKIHNNNPEILVKLKQIIRKKGSDS